MRAAVLIAAVLALATPASAQDADPARALSVEVSVARTTWYVGERVVGTVRILVRDRDFLDAHVVQPYQRELDVPVRLVAPFLVGREVFPSFRHAETAAVALNDGVWGFRADGDALEASFLFEPSSPESIDLSTSLEMIVTNEFREDFVEGRVAVDPRPVRLAFPGPNLSVLTLPEEGRPADFSGGIGSFRVTASLLDTDPDRTGAFGLRIVVVSPAPDHDVEMPHLEGLAGFHLLGSRAGRDLGGGIASLRRTQRYELELLDPDVRQIPPIPFSYFDPVEGAYRTVHTDPVPIPTSVRAVGVSEPSADAGVAAETDGGRLVAIVIGLLLVIVGAVVVRRRNGRAAAAPAANRDAEEARNALGDPAADPAEVLVRYLAQRLGCASAAVVTPHLARRLERAGVAPDVAEHTAALLERLVAARYGGAAITDADRDEVRGTIARL